MPAHKLVLNDVFEQPYKLIAIHSSVEEYKLAYLLNKHLNLNLARMPKDIDLHKGKESNYFSHFIFEDLQKDCTYHLVSNIARQEGRSGLDVNSLFGDHLAVKKSILLPEFRQVDFLVKIEDELDTVSLKMLTSGIMTIPHISTAYAIDFHHIKNKENLIFD